MTVIDATGDPAARLPATGSFTVESLAVDVYRAPIARPVRTAFGTMNDRPALVVTVRTAGGVTGYGEAWCNFPAPAAEHRARIIASILAPQVVGRSWEHPKAMFDTLSRRTRALAIQAGEPGPFAHAIAGIDIALWDMAARRAGRPLWRFLGGEGNGSVATYASGIGPDGALDQALGAAGAGHRAFKLKIGFEERVDHANLSALRSELGPEAALAVDANQAWTPDAAIRRSRELAPYSPVWLEEPIQADRPPGDWVRLAEASPIPLAAGENLYGDRAFDRAIGTGSLAVIQPDATKWGGISGGLPLARRIVAAGLRYCPHYLGGGTGLVASAHLLVAAGGTGLLEIDCNPNPLRRGLARPFPELSGGRLRLGEAPGLGVTPGGSLQPVTSYVERA